MTDDVALNGLTGFSLRRAAAAAGTTHKVLLYHFGSGEELLATAVGELRARRIERGLAAALAGAGPTLGERVRAVWTVLTGPEETPLLQAMGLAMTDPSRYADLVSGSADQYLGSLRAICPDSWTPARRTEVAELILATLRGLLLARRTGHDEHDVQAGLRALVRALSREEDVSN